MAIAVKKASGIARASIKKLMSKTIIGGNELYTTSLFSDATLKAYYRLESDGTDSSSSGYNLTTSGSPTFSAGKFGNGVTTATSKYLYSNSTANLNITTGAISVGCWFKCSDSTNTQKPMVTRHLVGNGYPGWTMEMSDGTAGSAGKIRFTVLKYYPPGGAETSGFSSTTYNDGNWHFAVGVRPTSGGTLKIYVDGSSRASSSNSNIDATASTAKFNIGTRDSGSDGVYFPGSIDDVFVFIGKELSSTEVSNIYNTQIKKYMGISNV